MTSASLLRARLIGFNFLEHAHQQTFDSKFELTYFFSRRDKLCDELLELPAVLCDRSVNPTECFFKPLDERAADRCCGKFTQRLLENAAVLPNVLQKCLESEQRCNLFQSIRRNQRILNRLE